MVADRNDLQQRYRELLLESMHFHTVGITSAVAEEAASIRATYGLRLPDALQIALKNGCDAFVCNDRAMGRVTELRILILDDLEL